MNNHDKSLRKLTRIYSKISNLFNIGKYDKLLEFFEEKENQFKNLPRELRKEAGHLYCESLLIIAIIFSYRGDLTRSFEFVKKTLKIAEEIDDKYCLSIAKYGYGRTYWLSGDLIQALKYFDRAIELEQDIEISQKYIWVLNSIMMAVRVAVAKGDLEIAKKYYGQVEMSHLKSSHHKMVYNMTKALILKSSTRFRDRAMAEEIFKEIIENENYILNNRLLSLVDLCEILLIELRITNDINIVDEIKPLIIKILDFAQIINSFYYIIEANIIQAKLALINFEINDARRFLTQAQRMAERYGYTKLVIEITDLHGELIQQSESWDHLKEINAPV
ncbi:MAG: tetratricopeptide repeat protein, partial [Candidatus Lokiarchaeota archaeon]|nr:tetratricopeptide repeat protein [Candidatus Lokiarchaeota archaeon]